MNVSKDRNTVDMQKENRRVACNGSEWYDSADRYGRQPKCGACEGTGMEWRNDCDS